MTAISDNATVAVEKADRAASLSAFPFASAMALDRPCPMFSPIRENQLTAVLSRDQKPYSTLPRYDNVSGTETNPTTETTARVVSPVRVVSRIRRYLSEDRPSGELTSNGCRRM
jgi:hypothetical protein